MMHVGLILTIISNKGDMHVKTDKQSASKKDKKQDGKGTTPYHFASYAEIEAEKMKSK